MVLKSIKVSLFCALLHFALRTSLHVFGNFSAFCGNYNLMRNTSTKNK